MSLVSGLEEGVFGVGQKYEERELRKKNEGWFRTISDEPVSGWSGGCSRYKA